ncbi:MAG: sigma-70 family RNA polymerase sigma factor [Candidatus Hydrogenedens sp.]|nr:sigma-70 family RNA polymerase sigma factor [Candidatus Hydrogenedens sp.]
MPATAALLKPQSHAAALSARRVRGIEGHPMTAELQSSTDESLMELLASGRQDALASLVRRYQNDVFRFCLHYVKDAEVAKEMSQETFIRVYTARERFDVSRRFKPWMLCIARNLCLNELKRRKMVHMETLEEYVSTAREDGNELLKSPSDAPDEQLMTGERHSALMAAIDRLPEDQSEVIKLRYFDQLSAREIAEIVDSTEGAIRTRLHRILKQLRVLCADFIEEV